MLNTIIDFEIFDEFTNNQPQPIPLGSLEENNFWLSFWEYLKSGSNVIINNYRGQQNIFLNNLTRGREGTSVKLDSVFKKPHKCTFPKNYDIRTVFFLDEPVEVEKSKYRKNNGFVFGFKDDYSQIWKNLALLEKPEVLPVRKEAKFNFKSWSQLSDYILPFTDLIIVDNYMFDESVWEYNLLKIIEECSKKTPRRFNLLLMSFIHSKYPPNINELYNKLIAKFRDKDIICDLSIALATETIKEHDRGIFTNYLRIKSGDSFNYFDKDDKFFTKGTDIDFHTLVQSDKFNSSEEALSNISKIIIKLKDIDGRNRLNDRKRLKGKFTNKLLKLY